MNIDQSSPNIVFAIYPNANGFGYVFLESARKLLDFGVFRVNPISNQKVLKRVKDMFAYMRPSLVIIQDPEGKSSRTGKRVRNLISNIVSLASESKLDVSQFTRDQIRDVFEQFGVRTKHEISQILIKEFKELELKLPKKRKLWTSEDRNMAIFDALSLAITWYFVNT